jgi:hypothetical protein
MKLYKCNIRSSCTLLHTQYTYLLPMFCPVFFFVINYCFDMFRPQFLTALKKLARLSTYTAYVATCAKERDQGLNVIRIKILNCLKSVFG